MDETNERNWYYKRSTSPSVRKHSDLGDIRGNMPSEVLYRVRTKLPDHMKIQVNTVGVLTELLNSLKGAVTSIPLDIFISNKWYYFGSIEKCSEQA